MRRLKHILHFLACLFLLLNAISAAFVIFNDGSDLPFFAQASQEVTNSPSDYEDVGFINPSFAFSSDDNHATMGVVSGGYYGTTYFDYGFEFEDMEIEEVYVYFEHKSSVYPNDTCRTRLSNDGGSSWGDWIDVDVDPFDYLYEVNMTDYFEWIGSDLSDDNFRVRIEADIEASGCYHPDSEVGLWEEKSIDFDMNVKNIADVKKGDVLLGYNRTSGEYIPNLMLSDAIILEGKFTFYHFLIEYPMSYWDKEIYPWENPKEKGYKDTCVTAEQRLFTVEKGLINASEVEEGMHLHGLFRQNGRLITIPVPITKISTVQGNKAVMLNGTSDYFFSHYMYSKIVKTYRLDWIPVKVVYSSYHNITFYFHQCGTILVNGSITANGTTNVYAGSEVFNLTAVPSEGNAFLKHVYDSVEIYENPLIFTVDGNYTLHTWLACNESFNPNSETLVGGTTQTSGSFPADLEENDQSYKIFQSAVISQPYEAEDFVDDNTTDVDGSDSIGFHSNFTAMQYSDSNYDNITDEDSGAPNVESLYVESWTNVIDDWTRVGADPYLDAQDQPTNYVHVSDKTKEEGDFNFTDVQADGYDYTLHTVHLAMYCDAGSEKIYATLHDGSGWSGDYTFQGSGWAWRSVDVLAFLDTKTKIDDALLHLESAAIGGFAGSVAVDAVYLRVNLTASSYTADLELQFTDVPYDKENEYLCIKTGSRKDEDLGVRGWNGSAWIVIDPALSWSTWNNYSVSSFLTSSTFTIDLNNTASEDAWWNFDAVLLHLWQDGEYNATIEFEGSSNDEIWQKLNWTLDTAVTNASVSVTYQLYNYTEGAYASSGLGYIAYTSSATPNTDELKWQQMNTTDCIDFRDGANDWKLKIEAYSNPSGMGNTTLQHEIKIDWIQVTAYWICTGIIEEVVVREIIFLLITCLFFSGYYEFNKEKVWSAILGAGLWIVISLLWIIRSVDLWILCLIFSGIGIFYILRAVLKLLEMRQLRQRGLGNDNVSV